MKGPLRFRLLVITGMVGLALAGPAFALASYAQLPGRLGRSAPAFAWQSRAPPRH